MKDGTREMVARFTAEKQRQALRAGNYGEFSTHNSPRTPIPLDHGVPVRGGKHRKGERR